VEEFRKLGLSEAMLATIARKGFSEPTPVQKAIIPFLLTGSSDVVAQAETGTGKTAAFGIPILEQMGTPDGRVKTLVLVPTRELAVQVAGEIRSFRGSRKVEILSVYGGQPFGVQRSAIKGGADIVVGTTGRILDHLEKGTLRLDNLSCLVLDEADEMLDMGFIDDIRTILEHTPEKRRTMLFSATMPREVISIARRYMKAYETITTVPLNKSQQLTDQVYLEVREQDKFEALCRIIDMEPEFYGLVFCRTRVETAEIAECLIKRGYGALAMHGEIEQRDREHIMRRLRSRQITILVATDVAARGIDVSDLTHVINYDPPQDPDSYLHRIGRTGRAGKKGTAITLVTPGTQRSLDLIRRTTGKAMRRGTIPGAREIIASKRARIAETITRGIQKQDFAQYSVLAAELLERADPLTVLAACLHNSYGDELNPGIYKEIRTASPTKECTTHSRRFTPRGRPRPANAKTLHKHGKTPKKGSRP